MKCYTPSDLQAMDRYVRANFVNCLSGFKPAALIVSQDKNGLSNVALFNNIVHLGADPALIGFINRPREATPHTLGNIESTGFYTINHINPSQISAAHQTSAKYPTGVSEFEKVELVEQFRPEFSIPFVEGSPAQIGLRLVEIVPIQQNGTYLVIGELQCAFLEEAHVSADGFVDLAEAGAVSTLGLQGYYQPKFIQKEGYARP
ncbi:flavin reductase family protein [Aquirufa sp. 5-AUSEE-100C1]|jgi:flavin reductase (DIM6/NTAB) family NADH-FMN oxidoreductase RutF